MDDVVWIIILVVIIFIILKPSFSYFNSGKKWELAVLCIVKNEDMILEEWFDHHIWQGVQHFYVIDNESTDGTKSIIDKYVSKGLVTYYHLEGQAKQKEYYNKIYSEKAKDETKWLAVIDADEFMYNRTKGQTMRDYVSNLDPNTAGGARLQFKMFGSSDHDKQPKTVRDTFLWREKFEPTDTCCPWKTIVNTAETDSLDVHDHPTRKPIVKDYDQVIINHYQILSREYYEKVKMTRGDVAFTSHNRDWKYFEDRDFKEEKDEELTNLMS